MPPRILISAVSPQADAAFNYENALRAAGGAFTTRYCPDVDLSFDGLLLTGGGDIDPPLYGQESRGSLPPDHDRDRAELALAQAWLQAGKPILGICRGMQLLNVALGGTLIQDLGPSGNLLHRWITRDKVHPVCTRKGSVLHALYGPVFRVNSAHHQAVAHPGAGAIITAHGPDATAEALELPGRPVLGVQFHPERMTGAHLRADTVDGRAVFQWFLAQCSK